MDDKKGLILDGDSYRTAEGLYPVKRGKLSFLRTAAFYAGIADVVLQARKGVLKGKYDFTDMIGSSRRVFSYIEKTGARINITGIDNLRKEEGPVVVVANHMSTLETFVFPFLVGSVKECSFVVKKSLVTNPIFGPVMKFLNPIAVERKDPRKDLDLVMTEGSALIKNGISVILFPQATRSSLFEPEKFNSLGIKLAKRGGVKIVPVAVKTDFWENGKMISSFGYLYPERTVYFEFGEAVPVDGAGKKEHREIIEFIENKIKGWQN